MAILLVFIYKPYIKSIKYAVELKFLSFIAFEIGVTILLSHILLITQICLGNELYDMICIA